MKTTQSLEPIFVDHRPDMLDSDISVPMILIQKGIYHFDLKDNFFSSRHIKKTGSPSYG